MQDTISTISGLYETYKYSPNVILKLKNYIHNDLPILLKKYNEEEKKKSFLEKQVVNISMIF